jgi:hypothetical protein
MFHVKTKERSLVIGGRSIENMKEIVSLRDE